MAITRDIIEDLIPVYLSGEASVDTQKTIQRFMADNPELNYLLEVNEFALPETRNIQPEKEMQTLKKIKFLALLKSLFIGLGIFFTCSIFVFTFSSEGTIKWLMLGSDEITVVYITFAAICWFVVFLLAWLKRGVFK